MTPAELASALAELGAFLPLKPYGGTVVDSRERVVSITNPFIPASERRSLATLIAQAVNAAGGMEET